MKRMKLNVLVAILLVLVLCISFAFMLINSFIGFKQYKTFALNTAEHEINNNSDAIFIVDIYQQASMASQIFREVAGLVKIASFAISNSQEVDQLPILKYNKKKELYTYYNKSNFIKNGNNISGYIINSWNKHFDINKNEIKKDLSLFTKSIPALKEICLNNSIVSAMWVATLNDSCVIYSANITHDIPIIDRDKSQRFIRLFEYIDLNKDVVTFSKVYLGLERNYILSVMYPVFDRNKKPIGLVGLNLKFKNLLRALYSDVLKEFYSGLNIIRLFLNDEGFLMFYPKTYYDLLSLPKTDKSMILDQDNIYNINLSLSESPSIKNLAEKIKNNDKGKEKITIKGEEYIVSYEAIPFNKWKMAVMIKSNDLYRGFYEIKNNLKNVFNGIQQRVLILFVVILLVAILFSLLIFKKQIVKPIENLRNKIRMLGDGDFSIKLKEKGIQEIVDLAKSFNSLGVELGRYIKRLEKEIINRESVEKEIKLARRIQENIIPVLGREFDNDKFLIKAKLEPAKNVSGDFYDAFYINDNKVALVVADVSGKGFPAAFFMAIARTTIKNLCLMKADNPASVLRRANERLVENNKTSMFVTAFLGFYEIDTGKLIYANAGHLPPIIFSPEKELDEIKSVNDPPLGCLDDFEYSSFEKVLEIGDVLILFTDGVTEAEQDGNELFGDKRLKGFIKNNSNLKSNKFLDKLFETLFNFQKNIIADDITVFLMKRKK
jgi:serine phosphatase RsbU (regulator of sigma subunit)